MARWRVREGLTTHRDGETAVLLDLRTNAYYELNATALHIWEQVRDGAATDAIAASLVANFDVAPPDARSAVDELLADLLAEGLVEDPGRPDGLLRRMARRISSSVRRRGRQPA